LDQGLGARSLPSIVVVASSMDGYLQPVQSNYHDIAEVGSEFAVSAGCWPTTIHEVQHGMGLENKYKQRPTTSTTIYFRKKAERPLDISFVDSMGLVHYIQVDNVPVRVLVPLDQHVLKNHRNFNKVLEWCSERALKSRERTLIDPRASIVECCFSYQPAAMVHTHGIVIDVIPYGLKAGDTALRRDMGSFEQEFWRARLDEVRANMRLLDVDCCDREPRKLLHGDEQQYTHCTPKQAELLERLEDMDWDTATPAVTSAVASGNPCLSFLSAACCSAAQSNHTHAAALVIRDHNDYQDEPDYSL